VIASSATVGSATLILPSTTNWSASVGSGSTWLSVTPTSGTGGAPLTYRATANTASTSRTGTITIDGQTLSVTQAAATGAAGILTLSSSTLGFGADTVGLTIADQSVLLSNTGGTAVTVGTITITGTAKGDYADTGTCAAGLVLAPGASCYLQVSFDPTAAGSRPAVLQIGSTSIALSGTGEQSTSGDGPLPLWAYALMGIAIMGIVISNDRRAAGRIARKHTARG
jgi:hypothetical protein